MTESFRGSLRKKRKGEMSLKHEARIYRAPPGTFSSIDEYVKHAEVECIEYEREADEPARDLPEEDSEESVITNKFVELNACYDLDADGGND